MGTEDEAAKAVAALTRQVTGLEKAAEQAAAAVSHAGTTVAQAQRAGFGRVAENAADLRGRAEKLSAMLTTAAGQVKPGQSAAAEATGQDDPEKAIASLEVTVSAVDTVRASLLEAAQQANDLESRTAQVLRGAQPETLIQMFRSVRESARQAAKQGDAAEQHAQRGIEQGRQISAGGGSGN